MNVLDPKYANLKQIRAHAGRAFLDGPHEYDVQELSGPLLDLAVANVLGILATIHLVPNSVEPFYECCTITKEGRFHTQYMPSRNYNNGGHIMEQNRISSFAPCADTTTWVAHLVREDDRVFRAYGDTQLIAAMRALVKSEVGNTISL